MREYRVNTSINMEWELICSSLRTYLGAPDYWKLVRSSAGMRVTRIWCECFFRIMERSFTEDASHVNGSPCQKSRQYL